MTRRTWFRIGIAVLCLVLLVAGVLYNMQTYSTQPTDPVSTRIDQIINSAPSSVGVSRLQVEDLKDMRYQLGGQHFDVTGSDDSATIPISYKGESLLIRFYAFALSNDRISLFWIFSRGAYGSFVVRNADLVSLVAPDGVLPLFVVISQNHSGPTILGLKCSQTWLSEQ
jgi:hypothetical protein